MNVYISPELVSALLTALILTLVGVLTVALAIVVVQDWKKNIAKKKLEKSMLERMKKGEEVELTSTEESFFGYKVLKDEYGVRHYPRLSLKDGKVYVSGCRRSVEPVVFSADVYLDLLRKQKEEALMKQITKPS